MNQNKDERKVFFCECSSPDHLMVWEVVEWHDQSPTELYIYYRMKFFANFWKRLCIGFKYIFKIGERDVDHTEILIYDTGKLTEMRNMIDKVIELNKSV